MSDVGDFVRWLKTERSALDVVDSFCREFRATGDAERAYLSASMRAAMR